MSSFSSLISGSVMKIWHANALVDHSWPRDVIFSGFSGFEIFNLCDILEIFINEIGIFGGYICLSCLIVLFI